MEKSSLKNIFFISPPEIRMYVMECNDFGTVIRIHYSIKYEWLLTLNVIKKNTKWKLYLNSISLSSTTWVWHKYISKNLKIRTRIGTRLNLYKITELPILLYDCATWVYKVKFKTNCWNAACKKILK